MFDLKSDDINDLDLLIFHRLPSHIYGSRTRSACAEALSAVYERGRLGTTPELPFGAQLYGRIVGNGKLFFVNLLTSIHQLFQGRWWV